MSKCQVTIYGRPCCAKAYCTFRKRSKRKGAWVYKVLICCEEHAKNRTRTNDTYIHLKEDESDSPYWESVIEGELEETRANPDSITKETIFPWALIELEEDQKELANKIKQNIYVLSFRERQILNLICYKNLTQAKIASVLNIKPQSVSMYVKRIQNKLRNFVL